MIRKVNGGYVIYSGKKSGGKRKRLSRKYKTRKAAVKRLRQIEFFKRRKK